MRFRVASLPDLSVQNRLFLFLLIFLVSGEYRFYFVFSLFCQEPEQLVPRLKSRRTARVDFLDAAREFFSRFTSELHQICALHVFQHKAPSLLYREETREETVELP